MLDTRLQHTPHPLERLCATRRATRAAKLAADYRRAKLPLGPVVFGPVVCRRHLLVVEKHKQVIPLLLQPTLDQSPQSQSANQLDPASVADPPSLLTLSAELDLFGGKLRLRLRQPHCSDQKSPHCLQIRRRLSRFGFVVTLRRRDRLDSSPNQIRLRELRRPAASSGRDAPAKEARLPAPEDPSGSRSACRLGRLQRVACLDRPTLPALPSIGDHLNHFRLDRRTLLGNLSDRAHISNRFSTLRTPLDWNLNPLVDLLRLTAVGGIMPFPVTRRIWILRPLLLFDPKGAA